MRTTFAGWEYVLPSRTNRRPPASPSPSVSTWSTLAPVSTRSRPVASARAMTVRSVDAFAPWWQTLCWQNPQYVQAPRPPNGSALIAGGPAARERVGVGRGGPRKRGPAGPAGGPGPGGPPARWGQGGDREAPRAG